LPGAPRTDPGVQFSRTGLFAVFLGYFRTRQINKRQTVPLVDPRPVRYAGKHRLHMLFGLSIPHVALLPALPQRRSLPRPRWSRGSCARFSRALSITNRSDSLPAVGSPPIRQSAYLSLADLPCLPVPSTADRRLPLSFKRLGGRPPQERAGPPTFRTYLLPHAMLSDSGGCPSCLGLS
jgi:hypothetical protein